MRPLYMTDFSIVSCLGAGLDSTLAALRQGASGLRPCDFLNVDLEMYIGRIEGVEDRPVPSAFEQFDCRNNRIALMGVQQGTFLDSLAETKKRYGADRIAVILGTSTSGILETELAYRKRQGNSVPLPGLFSATYPFTHDTFSSCRFLASLLGLGGPVLVVSTACSSSAKVFASASRMIEVGLCDAALVGGVDSLCFTTLYGFHSLGLVSEGPCRPFDQNRNGLTIGEGAGFILLDRDSTIPRTEHILFLGYGESCDGHHMSHPHPDGTGAILAMKKALRQADMMADEIDYIHLHGTATPANDRVEDHAVATVFGDRMLCSSTKGWTGHTLGAAGGIGAVLSGLCLSGQFVPRSEHTQQVDKTFRSNVVMESREYSVRRVMSNFFGFGGSNCCLIFGMG